LLEQKNIKAVHAIHDQSLYSMFSVLNSMKGTKGYTMITIFAALSVAAMLVISPALSASAVQEKGTLKTKNHLKSTKCNNVKIQVKVSNIPSGSDSLVGKATLGGKTVSKTSVLGKNESKVTIPLNFKKLTPCPAVGDSFSGDVNGTSFSGTLTSLKTPNKVKVSLP
jgi:hypothetical protein